jgi:hypothetical protein
MQELFHEPNERLIAGVLAGYLAPRGPPNLGLKVLPQAALPKFKDLSGNSSLPPQCKFLAAQTIAATAEARVLSKKASSRNRVGGFSSFTPEQGLTVGGSLLEAILCRRPVMVAHVPAGAAAVKDGA